MLMALVLGPGRTLVVEWSLPAGEGSGAASSWCSRFGRMDGPWAGRSADAHGPGSAEGFGVLQAFFFFQLCCRQEEAIQMQVLPAMQAAAAGGSWWVPHACSVWVNNPQMGDG